MTHTRLESILERAFETSQGQIQVTGASTALALSYFLSQTYAKNINSLPHLVVTGSLAEAQRVQQLLKFFDPSRHSVVLPAFDVSPYSGLYPNNSVIAGRLQFLHRAQHARPGEIFIAPIDAIMQKTLPPVVLQQRTLHLKAGSELPENLSEFLDSLGYSPAPMVEDKGQYAIRGGIVDIFVPTEDKPVRLDLFGDQIESLRHFNVSDQRSDENLANDLFLTPAREYLFRDEAHEALLKKVRESMGERPVDKTESDELLRSLVLKNSFPGIEFLLPAFYQELFSPVQHFKTALNIWLLDPVEISRNSDETWTELKSDFNSGESLLIRPELDELYQTAENIPYPKGSRQILFSSLAYFEEEGQEENTIEYRTALTQDFTNIALTHPVGSDSWIEAAGNKLVRWRNDGYRIFVGTKNQSHIERLALLLEKMELKAVKTALDEYKWDSWLIEQDQNPTAVHIVPRSLSESLRFDEEKIVFLRDEDFLGKKQRTRESSGAEDFQKQAKRLSFGDLKPNDLVVHVKHGIGLYEGLKIMNIGGVESEYIQLSYKDKDKLYLPVYRVGQLQKFSGANTTVLDKLGGVGWDKVKSKVKNHVRDIASDLLALYAKRAEMHRPPFVFKENEVQMFENGFPYEETEDQWRAINDISKDLLSTKPMDRLVCGDVGFGKTEVAMRAAFFAVQARKQVAVLAPTTVLTFQHFETFKKRFAGWPVEIRVLNRFVSTAESKKIVQETKDGKVDILIGTHKLLGNTIGYKDLGLLIVDEEQKFGVGHKEKIKKMKTSVDTMALSATPIPRTLNLSLVGIRDLSIINTAPVDRLPTRTFVCKFDPETIRKAISAEISRGGQVYFIHNRIESIYGLADEIRQIVPEARIRVAHGQMEEHELEKAMLSFFHHEIDVLVCTAIVESGMDVSRANTMFIDSAHMFGLSQLYQLRGRVGRSKTRAYCYLMMPRQKKLDKEQQERLKIIQENTALGSGIKIAQYDLELRGAGNILGEDQSGHINSVGYELYMDLLNEALAEAKGESIDDIELDPEINLRIPAMIPDNYISDIRIRLSYYKALAEITSADDLDRIEEELRDQFGQIPEPTINLMGLMLIRHQCKELGVRDISAGVKSISLIFTEKTKIKIETVVQLAVRESQKYSLTPDNRLNIKMSPITWSSVHSELSTLLKLI